MLEAVYFSVHATFMSICIVAAAAYGRLVEVRRRLFVKTHSLDGRIICSKRLRSDADSKSEAERGVAAHLFVAVGR